MRPLPKTWADDVLTGGVRPMSTVVCPDCREVGRVSHRDDSRGRSAADGDVFVCRFRCRCGAGRFWIE